MSSLSSLHIRLSRFLASWSSWSVNSAIFRNASVDLLSSSNPNSHSACFWDPSIVIVLTPSTSVLLKDCTRSKKGDPRMIGCFMSSKHHAATLISCIAGPFGSFSCRCSWLASLIVRYTIPGLSVGPPQAPCAVGLPYSDFLMTRSGDVLCRSLTKFVDTAIMLHPVSSSILSLIQSSPFTSDGDTNPCVNIGVWSLFSEICEMSDCTTLIASAYGISNCPPAAFPLFTSFHLMSAALLAIPMRWTSWMMSPSLLRTSSLSQLLVITPFVIISSSHVVLSCCLLSLSHLMHGSSAFTLSSSICIHLTPGTSRPSRSHTYTSSAFSSDATIGDPIITFLTRSSFVPTLCISCPI